MSARFVFVEENAVPCYNRPCGCEGGNYMPDGVRHFSYSRSFPANRNDLIECKMCGAVWRLADCFVDGAWSTP